MPMSNKVIRIQNEVNPNFKSVWQTKKAYNILKGGRNSFKSSVLALLLVYMMIPYLKRGEKVNIVVIRKVGNTIRDSVYLKIKWALDKFFIAGEFKATVAPFKLEHRETGSSFYFYGQDDFQKLKSNDIGNIIAVWYEEAAEFAAAEEFDQSNTTFMRQKPVETDYVRIFWSYNPPRNQYAWINEWAEKLKSANNYLVHESSYLDDTLGFVTPQMLEEINRIKENDYDYYRYMYLGEAVGLGTNVYNMTMFHEIDELFSDDPIISIYYSIDGGHAVSATPYLCLGLTAKGKVILLDMYYYSPAGRVVKKAPSELSDDLHEFITKTSNIPQYRKQIRRRTIDSAEAALRNQYYKDHSQRLNPVAKKRKHIMIDYVHDLLAQGRFFVLTKPVDIGMKHAGAWQTFIEEHRKYQWDEKTVNSENPSVIKEDDHSVDAFQYFCVDNARDLKLKV